MSDLATRLRTACDQVRVKSYPLSDLIPLMQQAADAIAAAPAQPAPSAASAEPLQAFDSPRAKSLMRAWEEGWEACRDAEYVGEEAQNDAFNSSHTLTLCLAEDQLLPTPQADSQPAPVAAFEVADAMADSQYLAGVSAGWNAANADDPNAALQKLHESRTGYLKPLSAARAPADSVLEDAARLDWLEEQVGKSSSGISFDWVKHVEDGYVTEKGYRFMRRHFLGERAATLRAAIDAARKQGANHD